MYGNNYSNQRLVRKKRLYIPAFRCETLKNLKFCKLLEMLEEKTEIGGIKRLYVNEAYISKTYPVCATMNIVKEPKY